MANRQQQRGNNRDALQSDWKINSSKKVPKKRKYEGKCFETSCSACFPRSSRAAAINRGIEEFSLLVTRAVRNFSNMFTTYSHMLCIVLASRLETRNQLRKRQEKNEFNFQFRQKNFLDGQNDARVWSPKRETVVGKTSRARIQNRREEQNSLLVGSASRVDRIHLCAQLLASASGA